MAAEVDVSTSSPSLFQYFLSKLSEEHHREVSELQHRNSQLHPGVRELVAHASLPPEATTTLVPQPPRSWSSARNGVDVSQASMEMVEADEASPSRSQESSCLDEVQHVAVADRTEVVGASEDANRGSIIALVSFSEAENIQPCANTQCSESWKELECAGTEEEKTQVSCLSPTGKAGASPRGARTARTLSFEPEVTFEEVPLCGVASDGTEVGDAEAALEGERCLSSQTTEVLCEEKLKEMSRKEKEDMKHFKITARLCASFKLANASNDVIMETYFQAWHKHVNYLRTSVQFTLRPTWENMDPSLDASVATRAKSRQESRITQGHLARSFTQSSEVSEYMSHGNMTHGSSLRSHEVRELRCFSKFILSPNSFRRITWDIAGACLLFYDIITIPMIVFNPPRNNFTTAMDWITMIFWTGDMLASCLTGYLEKGAAVMDPRKIIWNYLRGWFALDVAVVVPDWTFTVTEMLETKNGNSSGESAQGGKMLRALRVLRVARLLRLAKLKRIISILKDQIDSEATFIVLNVCKMIFMMLIVNHFLACIWYAMGVVSEPNWIDGEGLTDASLSYRYATSMHWSLTQFTPGSMSVQPHCVAERVFAISVLVFGLVLFSSIVGSITASMTQLRGMSEEKSKQFWLLRRYLRQREIDHPLSYRVLRYVEYAMHEEKDLVSEQRIWVLSYLSAQLRDELNFEVSFSCLNNHPLFMRTTCLSDDMMSRLSRTALTQQSLAPGDLLFSAGSQATHMHMVVTGQLQYIKAEDMDTEDPPHEVTGGDWACEVSLWTTWTCVGTSRSTQESKLVQIEAEAYGEAVRKDGAVWNLAAHYARKYLRWINGQHRGELTDAARKNEIIAEIESFLDEDHDDDGRCNSRDSLENTHFWTSSINLLGRKHRGSIMQRHTSSSGGKRGSRRFSPPGLRRFSPPSGGVRFTPLTSMTASPSTVSSCPSESTTVGAADAIVPG